MRMAGPVSRTTSYDGDVESRPPVELGSPEPTPPRYRSYSHPFAGRLGANQAFTIDRRTSADDKLLEKEPDATPHMSFRELLDCRPIFSRYLWKAALIEGFGEIMLLTGLSILINCRHTDAGVHHDLDRHLTTSASHAANSSAGRL
jgi:hypothetical protein